MSHQAQVSDSGSGEHHQELKRAWKWLTKGADFSSVRFRSDCQWSLGGIVMTAILWAWSGEGTLAARFAQAKKIGRRALGAKHVPDSSYQAFTKLLRTWTVRLLAGLARVFRTRMTTVFANRLRLGKFVPFGVDGSRFGLPRRQSNEAHFSPSAKKRKGPHQKKRGRSKQSAIARAKKADTPQMWVTTLWHLGIGLPWSWRLGSSNSSERGQLLDMLGELEGLLALLVADAGFFGYEFWSAIRLAGQHFVIRVGSHVRLLKKLGYAKERNGLVYCWPDRAAMKSQPPLVLRLIVFTTASIPCIW